MNDALYYHSQYVGFESGAEYVNGLYDFAVNHMKTVRNPSEPRNFLLWHFSTVSLQFLFHYFAFIFTYFHFQICKLIH